MGVLTDLKSRVVKNILITVTVPYLNGFTKPSGSISSTTQICVEACTHQIKTPVAMSSGRKRIHCRFKNIYNAYKEVAEMGELDNFEGKNGVLISMLYAYLS